MSHASLSTAYLRDFSSYKALHAVLDGSAYLPFIGEPRVSGNPIAEPYVGCTDTTLVRLQHLDNVYFETCQCLVAAAQTTNCSRICHRHKSPEDIGLHYTRAIIYGYRRRPSSRSSTQYGFKNGVNMIITVSYNEHCSQQFSRLEGMIVEGMIKPDGEKPIKHEDFLCVSSAHLTFFV